MSVTIDGPADFPALFRSADRESQRAQRSYLTSLRVRLGSLVVAAFGGALTLTTAGGFQVGGGLAFLAFACALGAELFLATTSPLTTWSEGRAAAESAKTLAWRYMVALSPSRSTTWMSTSSFPSLERSLCDTRFSVGLRILPRQLNGRAAGQ